MVVVWLVALENKDGFRIMFFSCKIEYFHYNYNHGITDNQKRLEISILRNYQDFFYLANLDFLFFL